ncbi:hypothetical protein [Streptomyces sp. Go40/10]|nr:hypothetical protein [Streptomyces sp. Go40/10]
MRRPGEPLLYALGIDPPAEKDDEVRVIVRIVPRQVVSFSP